MSHLLLLLLMQILVTQQHNKDSPLTSFPQSYLPLMSLFITFSPPVHSHLISENAVSWFLECCKLPHQVQTEHGWKCVRLHFKIKTTLLVTTSYKKLLLQDSLIFGSCASVSCYLVKEWLKCLITVIGEVALWCPFCHWTLTKML